MFKMISVVLVCMVALKAQAEFKAGYIDMQKAIQSTNEGKKAKSTLEKEFDKKKSAIKKQEDDLKKKMEDFGKKKMVLSDKVRADKERELQEEMMAFREEVNKSQMTMQQKEMELTKPILEKLQKVIADVAKEKSLSMVFRAEQGVMWAQTELDITNEVIKKYNK